MLTGLLVLLALSLPFGDMLHLFQLGALPVSLTSLLTLVAVLYSLVSSQRTQIVPDTAWWGAIGWSGAWLISSLAAPTACFPAALSAWELSAGAIIFASSRPTLSTRSRKLILSGLAGGLGIFIILLLTRHVVISFTGDTAPIPWAAFLAKPLTGYGPGSFPGLPLITGLLPRGGLLVALAGTFLLYGLGRSIHTLSRPKKTGAGRILPASIILALVVSGMAFNPLANPALGLGFWLALTALIPSSRPAYNGIERA